MTIETHTSNIEQWVQSVQIPYHASGILERASYHERWEKTTKKLEFLMKEMKDNREALSSHWTRVMANEHLMNLGAIYDAIGIYNAYSRKNINPQWNKLGHDQHFNTAYWWDFMGDTSIRDEGGYVVVLLSDEGIAYLNGIANKVKSSSSYDTNRKESVEVLANKWINRIY